MKKRKDNKSGAEERLERTYFLLIQRLIKMRLWEAMRVLTHVQSHSITYKVEE